jgi:RND family efflux transporter MFP subunit
MTTRVYLLVTPLFFLATASCERGGEVAHLPQTRTPTTAPTPSPAPTAAAVPVDSPAASTASPFLSGTTEAHRKSTLTPKVSSAITRVHVREGDMVKLNQPLVTLDTRDFLLRAQQAEAARDGAKVQVDAAKLDLNRIKSLLAEKAVPQSQFDAVDARYKGAVAGLAAAEAAVGLSQKALHDSVVRAPFDGLIIKRQVMPATPLVTLEEIDPVDLRIQVPAANGQVVVGDPVHVRIAATGQEMDLRLTRVVPSSDPKTRTFSAIVEIPNADHSLRSGLYAEVTLRPRGVPAVTAAEPAKARKRVRAPKD